MTKAAASQAESLKKHERLVTLLGKYKEAEAASNKTLIRVVESTVIKENHLLVSKLVNKIIHNFDMNSVANYLEIEDLEQAGCVGMLTAFKKWDPVKGRFSTYAMHWISKLIHQELAGCQVLKKSQKLTKTRDIRAAQDAARTRYGREATAKELQEVVRAKIEKAEKKRILKAKGREATQEELDRVVAKSITEDTIREWRMSAQGIVSLDEFVDDRTGSSITRRSGSSGASRGSVERYELVPDTHTSPETRMANAEMAKLLADGIKSLSPDECRVLESITYTEQTIAKAAASLSMDESTFKDLRDSALKKLKRKMTR
jgi:RNA polymerase sigma factor (sigma-70 family)